jgi:cobalt/nickel transport protein
MSRRAFLVTGLLVALLIAGVGSYYASSHPDGLEYVAEQTGFLDSAEDSPATESPLADYQTSGIDDARVSGGFAGVVGSLVVLLLMGSIAYAVRRRGRDDAPADQADHEPRVTR